MMVLIPKIMLCLLVNWPSHVVPLWVWGQIQLNVLLPLTQVPPFRHGLLEHSSKSEERNLRLFQALSHRDHCFIFQTWVCWVKSYEVIMRGRNDKYYFNLYITKKRQFHRFFSPKLRLKQSNTWYRLLAVAQLSLIGTLRNDGNGNTGNGNGNKAGWNFHI